ncbi:hypothetical protein ACLOJK_018021 [Asimina triloba]
MLGARAPGSVRPRPTLWSTYGAPSSTRDGRQPWLRPLPPPELSPATARASTPPPASAGGPQPPRPSSPAMHLLTVDDDEEDNDTAFSPSEPITNGPSSPRSKPLITTETTSAFQIRRGRKTTLITVATRGKYSSPIITAAAPNVFFSSPSHHPFFLNASVFVSVTRESSICRSRSFIMWTPSSRRLATHRPTLPPPRLLVHADAHCRRSGRIRRLRPPLTSLECTAMPDLALASMDAT